MGKNILIVVTSWDKLGETGKETGWYLPEVAHPYYVFKNAGCSVKIASPKGGKAPMDAGSAEQFAADPQCMKFRADAEAMEAVEKTLIAGQEKASAYDCIFYAGGHGPMWDFPDNAELAKLCAGVYEKGGVVSAVCHGTVGLVNVKLSSGEYLIKGQKVTSFTNAEEEAVGLMTVMPFALETKLEDRGAEFKDGGNWACNVVVSGRIVTGQNPASATETANAVLKVMG